jgi:hypothetical protein
MHGPGTREGRGGAGRLWTAALAVAALALALPGCSDECSRSSDCPAGQQCYQGSCRPLVLPDGTDDGLPPGDDAAGPDADADVAADGDEDGIVPPADDAAGADADGDVPGADADADGDDVPVIGCTTDGECTDGIACTTDHCNVASGLCEHTAIPDGGSCDNGAWCDGDEVCAGGICQPGTPRCPEESHGCTYDSCDDDTHACGTFNVVDGATCDTGSSLCGAGGGFMCVGGVCQTVGTARCDDGNSCTLDSCAPDPTGFGVICTQEAEPDGGGCTDATGCAGTTGRACLAGLCSLGTDAPCADGSLCRVTRCTATGACEEVTPRPDPPPLACEASFPGQTVQSYNDASSYNATCGTALTGGENVWMLSPPTGTSTVTLTLSGVVATGSLSVLVLTDHCMPSSCVAVSGVGGVVMAAVPPGGGVLYVVIDGAAGARGRYTLAVACG